MDVDNPMMWKSKTVSKAGWFLALSSMLLLLAVFLNEKFLHDLNDQDAIRGKVSQILHEKEKSMEHIMDVSLRTLAEGEVHDLDNVIDNDLYQKSGKALFVTLQDSLVYWSENRIPYETEWTSMEEGTAFVRLKDGWYVLKSKRAGPVHVTGIILIKKEYPYQNAYLENAFQEDFGINPSVKVTTEESDNTVESDNGKYLFSLQFVDKIHISEEQTLLLFLLCAVAMLFVFSSIYLFYQALPFFNRKKWLMLASFAIDVAILRLLFRYFEIPEFLYDSRLFSPFYFATSWLEASLGDLLINRLALLAIAFAAFRKYQFRYSHLKSYTRNLVHLIQLLVVALLYFALFTSLGQLVKDSSILLNLTDISNIDRYSLLAFLSITVAILSYFLFSTALIRNVWRNAPGKYEYLNISVTTIALIFPVLFLLSDMPCRWPVCLILIVFLLSFQYFLQKKDSLFMLPAIVMFMILFAISSTFMLNHYNYLKEKENRKIIASSLSSKRDPLLEYEFMKIKEKILSDSLVRKYFLQAPGSNSTETNIVAYIDENYFPAFWNKYEMLLTACDPEEVLSIQPEDYLVNCYDYFDDLIGDLGVQTMDEDLYYIDNQTVNNNYIAVLFPEDSAKEIKTQRRIYIEIYYKFVTETGLGYPELLIDKEINMGGKIAGYSYARYHEEKLIYKFGDYFYHLGFSPYAREGENSYYFDKDGYNHYVVRTDARNWLVISHKNPFFFDVVAPFSYLFIFFSLFLLFFIVILYLAGAYRKFEMNFRNRFQIAIISIIIISLIILGFITRAYIIDLNNKKNIGYLTERTYSVLVELEHKLGDYESIPPELEDYVGDLLYKFAQVFFSDINLYSLEGDLISSSRPQIFDENLLSRKMNRTAFSRLAYEKSLLYIHNEQIGKQEYLSAYIPFRNNRDRIIAYLNLPYFAKQDEMREEIADFLSAYINIYVLLIVLAILVTILVSRYVTRPLQLIREKLRNLSYSQSNEKIEWKRDDEIGELVAEYNRTLDELARSAELLARSERESAWREMARQVAHEIKNPLTPMKLSVQYLKKAWDERAPDWEQRLERFTRNIIEQIETLSRIAGEFSDFAKMPVAKYERLNLVEIINRSAGLFEDVGNVKITVNSPKNECFISADRQQMLRVFNNMLSNSVQAIGNKENGRIDIDIFPEEANYVVEISDNGSGIPAEQAERIFSPSFTTKSGGTGLGLAMVKNILSGIGATISFTSEEGVGTTFVLEIPAVGN